ncbi:hypothetical protein FRC00_003929 [Tulasnella sp. 408]|nr:hypothetical protein FRC00_003929 [Tulasnella sp. 408]
MLKNYDPVRSATTFRLPDPPVAPSPGEPAPVIVHKVDWEEVGLRENKGKVGFIIDNALTPEDCQKLLKAAELSAPWTAAAIHFGPKDQEGVVIEDYRKSSRILLDNFELADFILSKLKPHMPKKTLEAPESKRWQWGQDGPQDGNKLKNIFKKTNRVELTRLNERLRYLKYVEGDFLESHADGSEYNLCPLVFRELVQYIEVDRNSSSPKPYLIAYQTPDGSEISCLTLQLYLNGSKEELEGGATQFLSRRVPDTFMDVDPRPGRALIFEQTNLLHCGAKVLKGEKYAIRTDLMYKKVSD